MAHVSGTSGKATFDTVEYPVLQWGLTLGAEVATFATSKSGGWKTGVAGSKSATGTVTFKADGGLPVNGKTAECVFEHADYTTAGKKVTYVFNGICNQVDMSVNVDTGEAVGGTYAITAIGPVTITAGV